MEAIKHIFYKKQFNEEFISNNAILNKTPYKPKILILGTFNPNSTKTNFADFYYGRNYFWTALKNLFEFNDIRLNGIRMPKNGKPKKPLNPSLEEILEICKKLELTFADLISEVLHNQNPEYHVLDNDNICFEGKTYNLIQDDKKSQIDGLSQLDKLHQIKWNTDNIKKFLYDNPQLETIYFSRQPKGIWKEHWDNIKNDENLQSRIFTNIFTPSGQGKPVLNSMTRLLEHWIHNENPGFGKLNTQWLKKNGVDINKF